VGVAGDVRQYDLADRSPDFIAGAMYMPYRQAVGGDRQLPAAMALLLATGSDPADAAEGIARVVRDVNPGVPVSEIRTMEGLVEDSTGQSRTMAWLFAAFAGIAVLLAAVGTYGVVSWSTSQRTFEIGLRVALGASRGSVFALVLGQSLRLVVSGLVCGVAASLALSRALSAFLYATGAWDALTFCGVCGLLIVVAVLAGFFPARRAARVDAVTSLRAE